jgi:adenosine/AMP kinase
MNFIFGQTHFIKSVEDIYEAMVGSVPNAKFGLAFCESSGECLVRVDGNDEDLKGVLAPIRKDLSHNEPDDEREFLFSEG